MYVQWPYNFQHYGTVSRFRISIPLNIMRQYSFLVSLL